MKKQRVVVFLDYAERVLRKLSKIAIILYRLAQLADNIYKIIGRP